MPTSRATPVTCSANTRRVSVIELMVSASAATSPLASTVIFWERSPFATAVVTWAMLRTWTVRLLAIELTESVRSFQVPDDAGHVGLAAEDALRADLARDAGHLLGEHAQGVGHGVDGVGERRDLALRASTVIFCVRSPSATAVVTWAMLRTWLVRLSAMELTESVRSFQVPATPGDVGLAAEDALGADLAGHAGDLVREGAQLVDHAVDGVGEGQRPRPWRRPMIFCDRSPSATAVVTCGDVAHLVVRLSAMELTESVRSFQVPGDARHLGLAAELALGADLAGHAGDLGGEGRAAGRPCG